MPDNGGPVTSLTRKVLHAGAIALVGVLTDVGAQLLQTGSASPTRAVIVGTIIGGVARILGAVFSSGLFDSSTDARPQ